MDNPLKNVWFQARSSYGHARCEPGWSWSPPPLPDYDIWYVLSGEGSMKLHQREYQLKRGSLFILQPGDCPQAVQNDENRLTVLFLHFQIYSLQRDKQERPSLFPPRYQHIENTYLIETILFRLLSVMDRQELWKEDECDYLFKQLFLHLYREHFTLKKDVGVSPKQMQLIEKVISYIRTHSSGRVTHQELADHVNLSAQYLSRIFKQYSGISLKEYMTKVRLDRSMYLLTETSMNVSQVSESLGYKDIYTFSKQFKRYFGKSPSNYISHRRPSHSHYGTQK